MTKNELLKALKEKQMRLCVLSTVTPENTSESSVVGYGVTDDGKIIVSTHPNTRKWKNLEKNPTVSFVTGFTFTEMNVQIEGTAQRITQGVPLQETAEFFFAQNPAAEKFRSPDTVFISITPTWARILDPTQTPPKEEELAL